MHIFMNNSVGSFELSIDLLVLIVFLSVSFQFYTIVLCFLEVFDYANNPFIYLDQEERKKEREEEDYWVGILLPDTYLPT